MKLGAMCASPGHYSQKTPRKLDDHESGYGTFDTLGNDAAGTVKRPHASRSLPLGERWMAQIVDDTQMSALTIPGTHDSAAYTYSWPFVRTQTMNIKQQLEAGIRYLDFRCGLRDDVVEMVHGSTLLHTTLQELLDTVYNWLYSHSSEALIVQIKQDREAERSTVHFSQAITSCISRKAERWRTANSTPTLGELRGKIQLFRRFNGPNLYAYGIDVTRWQDNPTSPFTMYTQHGVRITVQDHYSFLDPEPLRSLITTKRRDVEELFEQASTNPYPGHWFINFSSAYEFNLYYQISPHEVAVGGYWNFRWENGMNVSLWEYLKAHPGRKRFGIVAMDFPEHVSDGLVSALIRSNLENGVPLACSCIFGAVGIEPPAFTTKTGFLSEGVERESETLHEE